MTTDHGWDRIEAAARGAFVGAGKFPIRAYSEFMPPPYVGIKPYLPSRALACATFGASDPNGLDVDEYEQAHDLSPGLAHIADRIVAELAKLMRGEHHALSKTLLADNPAWPADLAAAAHAGKLAHDPVTIAMPIALSRTQDDKGNDRWTLFGASHAGASAAFWRSFVRGGDVHATSIVDWLGGDERWRILADASDLPASLRHRRLGEHSAISDIRTIVTFQPFGALPAEVRARYLGHTLRIVPSPASLVFFEHGLYRKLAHELPHATQIPLLHVFPRVEGSCSIRIPQSGWLDEHDPAQATTHGHHIVAHVTRTHRWQRVARDAAVATAPAHGDGKYTDKVSVALFSTEPDVVGLYDKPLARNAQIWNADYGLVLDGPHADRAHIDRAAGIVDAGGRFGYRQLFPPMRGGAHELYWHVPLIAKLDFHTGHAIRLADGAPLGYVSAEHTLAGGHDVALEPRLLARELHVLAATQFERDPGHARYTTSHNIRKLLEAQELLGGKLAPSHARALIHINKQHDLSQWLAHLPAVAETRAKGVNLAFELGQLIGGDDDPGAALVIDKLGTREFEDRVWRSIAGLTEGEFRMKETADAVLVNKGKTGGPAAKAAHLELAARRDLEALGDHLHERYRALIAAHGMEGKAEVVDHVFRWETDFAFAWSDGWAKNQADGGASRERNIVLMIPGKTRAEAVIMGDHYDTADREDVYDSDRGGDTLRAPAAGADDNHSATTALLLAAEQLLPLAAAGTLERDVWLVHLTGEEFPADSLGARAICQQLVEGRLGFTAEDGTARDVSSTRVVGAFVLDMIGHNADRDRDVFQIAPGEGAAAARLARRAHHANQRWNRLAAAVESRRRSPRRGPRAPHARRQRAPAAVRAPAARRRDPRRVGATLGALQHRRPGVLRCRRAGRAVHGELRHLAHRLSRHARHDGQHRSRLLRRAHRDRDRERRRHGVRESRVSYRY